jgi:hypothetical protein
MAANEHRLKTWPGPFAAVRAGTKRHEYRINDRAFDEGDVLALCEWSPDLGTFTGQEERVRVTYISTGPDWGIPKGYAVMSIRRLSEEPCRWCGQMPHTIDCNGGKRPGPRRR